MSKCKRVIFISSALQQPRHQKRIDLLSSAYEVNVLYYERNKYQENYKHYVKNAKSLGVVKDGKYLSRILILIKLFWMLVTSKNKIVYCTSPEQMVIARLAGKKVFFEVGDLYQVDGKNRLFQIIDRIFIKGIKCLVLTSPYFYKSYFSRYSELEKKTVIVENKLPVAFGGEVDKFRAQYDFQEMTANKVRLGVIGSLAFKNSLMAIRDLMKSKPDYELHVYGDGLYNIFDGLSNVFYHGRFKSPEDLSHIYSTIDINMIMYDYDNHNVKQALPNKLYESIAFVKPIICSSGVALSARVEESGYGVATNADVSSLTAAVEQIVKNYPKYTNSLLQANSDTYLCFEQKDILSFLQKEVDLV